MTDRWAFRALVALTIALLFCLGCLLVAPLRVVGTAISFWLWCCALMGHHLAMPVSPVSGFSLIGAISSGALLMLMGGNSALTVWRLGRATRRLTCLTRTAAVPMPSVVAQLAARLNLIGSLVIIADRTPLSFCYGLGRPRICLSLGLIETLTEAELAAVLAHEAYHLRRREPLRMALAICLSRLFFFVPLLAELRDRYLAEKELAADAAAVAAAGRAPLAGAMVKLMASSKPLVWPALAAVAGMSVTAQRVDRLINPVLKSGWRPSRWSMVATLGGFSLSCLLMLTGLI